MGMPTRLLVFFVLLVALIALPFWVLAVLVFLCMLYFKLFIEGVVILLISDLLYGLAEPKFGNMLFISALASALVLALIEYLRTKLRLDELK